MKHIASMTRNEFDDFVHSVSCLCSRINIEDGFAKAGYIPAVFYDERSRSFFCTENPRAYAGSGCFVLIGDENSVEYWDPVDADLIVALYEAACSRVENGGE